MNLNSQNLAALFQEQLGSWEQAGSNYKALENVLVKEVNVGEFPFKVQFNPARIISSSAKVDTKSIQEIIGHADYSTTANIYTHLDIEELKKAIEKI